MKILLIPGLGFDCRIYDRIDFGNHEVERINWIEPKTDEPLRDYAIRLFGDRLKEEEKAVLIGHSLGGIVSQEIAVVKPVSKIILISSIQSREEMPMMFRIIQPLRLYKWFTKEITLKSVKYWGKNHDYVSESEQNLFRSMVSGYSNKYLQWALKSLSTWETPTLPAATEIFQISGTDDKNFPIKLIQNPDEIIEGGSHFMVYKNAERISEILRDELKERVFE